jgi:hypothetical protein
MSEHIEIEDSGVRSGVRASRHCYRPLLRPAGFATMPPGLKWDYVEVPREIAHLRPALPVSRHRYGVIACERELTEEECQRYELARQPDLGVDPNPATTSETIPTRQQRLTAAQYLYAAMQQIACEARDGASPQALADIAHDAIRYAQQAQARSRVRSHQTIEESR